MRRFYGGKVEIRLCSAFIKRWNERFPGVPIPDAEQLGVLFEQATYRETNAEGRTAFALDPRDLGVEHIANHPILVPTSADREDDTAYRKAITVFASRKLDFSVVFPSDDEDH